MRICVIALSLCLFTFAWHQDASSKTASIVHRLFFIRSYDVIISDLNGRGAVKASGVNGQGEKRSNFCITPSGEGLAYNSNDHNVRIQDFRSGVTRTVTGFRDDVSRENCWNFALSPDESAIVARNQSGFETLTSLSRFDTHTLQRTDLVKGNIGSSLVWNPSGHQVVYTADISGKPVYDVHLNTPPGGGPFPTYTFNIFELRAEGGKPTQLTNFPDGDCKNVFFGRDDNELFFTHGNDLFELDVAAKKSRYLYRIPAARLLQYVNFDPASGLFALSTSLRKIVIKPGALRPETIATEMLIFNSRSQKAKVIYRDRYNTPSRLQFAGQPLRLYFGIFNDGKSEAAGSYDLFSCSLDGTGVHRVLKGSDSNMTFGLS